jgi:long-chain fatty acid transport protein
MMNKRIRLLGCLGAMLSVHAIPAHAAFFQLAENSPAGLGNAFAGGAAIAEDASTVWYNPAGLTRLSRAEYIVAGHIIDPSTNAKSVSGTTVLGPLTPVSGGTGGDAGEDAVVPNFYYARRLNDNTVFGFGVNVPFGLATEYDASWAGRYHALRSEIKTVNLNPGIGYRFNDQFSVGAGISYQMIDAELSQAVDFATICTANGLAAVCGLGAGFIPGAGTNDGHAKVTADDKDWGYNLGLLWQIQQDTRLGLAYRSKIEFSLTGDFDIDAPANVPSLFLLGAGLVDSGARADVTVPATLSLSAYHQISPQWAIMGDVTRTMWSDLPELRIDFDSTQGDSVVTLDLKDVNRYSVGANYRPGGAWTYRFGVALDRSPTPNETVRTPRLPDEDRTWLAVGADYQFREDLSLGIALVRIELDDASVSKTATPTNENVARGNLTAEYEADVYILSAQARWAFK